MPRTRASRAPGRPQQRRTLILAASVLLVAAALAALAPPADAWDPDAGVVRPLGWGARTVAVTSNEAAKAAILDANDQTHWQSGACFPTGFVGRADSNPLLNACNSSTPSPCAATTGSKSLGAAFDNSVYTAASIAASGGRASLNVSLPVPTPVYRVFLKGSWNKGAATLLLVHQDGSSTVVTDSLSSNVTYKDLTFLAPPGAPWPSVAQVQVRSNDSFGVIELVAMGAPCVEAAVVDMGAAYDVSLVRARWWSPDSLAVSVLASADGAAWSEVSAWPLLPASLPTADFYLDPPIQARYLQIRHLVKESDWKKVYVWELSAYGAGGRWGPTPPPPPQAPTFRALMGLNGIWGWGNGSFSDTLYRQGLGPVLYRDVGSSGRNYHSMSWDVKAPGGDPKYETMNKTGTGTQWWLNWDREYAAWRRGGLPVAVSYQFMASSQPPSSWTDPYGQSYDLGLKFGQHFRQGDGGTGTVDSFEAGNEPWDYNATFYTTLLRGFLDGLSAGDPGATIKRLPCALQAHDSNSESATGGNYIGARLPQDAASKVHALNTHVYSFFTSQNGTRVAVHPEHPGSAMNAVHNMLAWRDANMPGTPVWVTEWGWDAPRPGEPYGMPEGVPQAAQAAYAVRGLALLARKGVEKAHWFFYANSDECNTLFCRSGLRDSKATRYTALPVYNALVAFLQMAGSSRFSRAALESSRAYAYVLADAAGAPTHVLAWRPVPVGEAGGPPGAADEPVSFDLGFAAAPGEAWALTGDAAGGRVAVPAPEAAGGSWTMRLSGVPVLVALAPAP